jgi:branched-chain amino acid transport system substrate-binding protein
MADPMIKLTEWQVKQEGGILGGRELKIVRYDNRGSVAEAVAGARKVMDDDKVSALLWGGVSGAESEAMANFAEQNKILYVVYGAINNAEKRSFTLSATVSYRDLTIPIINLVTKVLKPKTVGYLCTDLSDSRERVPIYKAGFEPAGTETVYEQYVTLGTADLSSYLTQMKYKNPDLLIIDSGNNEFLMTIAQQVMELGGWGNTKVITLAPGEFARSRAGAQGWYVTAMWAKGLTHPGALKFENDFKAAVGGTPMATQVYYYNAIWTAIEAIKLAGTDTDREKIANLARFSGKLEWETPMGRAHYTAESLGYPQLTPTMCQIIDKVMTRVEIPE